MKIVGTVSVIPDDAPRPLETEIAGTKTALVSERAARAFVRSAAAILIR